LLTTTRIYDVAQSNDGRKLVYTSNASGRLNLWIMNADGTGAHKLVTNDDRQTGARFTRDDSAVVYSQDRGGNEYYDIYVVPAGGGDPRNLTNTPDVSESVNEFSPDGKLLAIGVKQKTAPSFNLAVMDWPTCDPFDWHRRFPYLSRECGHGRDRATDGAHGQATGVGL
jgi:Tol biopolymer transport system component